MSGKAEQIGVNITSAILGALALITAWFIVRWWSLERRNRESGRGGSRPSPIDLAIGSVANFFDTLGIGSFATTTAAFKMFRRVADEAVPGTLNVGNALPTIAQAFIFIAIVTVEPLTLASMILAAVAGAWLGVGYVTRLPRRAIQIGMGIALLCAAALFVISLVGLMPAGGTAQGLSGAKLLLATGVSFLLGALMMLGVGLYAPCLILVSLLGMSPLVAFPIMMGSCAFLMPVGGARFIASGRYNRRAALGLAIGGIPAVLIAAYLVQSLPLTWLRWMVVVVVVYAALTMLWSSRTTAAPIQEGRSNG